MASGIALQICKMDGIMQANECSHHPESGKLQFREKTK